MATNIDGTSVVMGGYTRGTWVTEQAGDDDDIDIVGMSFDTDGTLLWTYQVRRFSSRLRLVFFRGVAW